MFSVVYGDDLRVGSVESGCFRGQSFKILSRFGRRPSPRARPRSRAFLRTRREPLFDSVHGRRPVDNATWTCRSSWEAGIPSALFAKPQRIRWFLATHRATAATWHFRTAASAFDRPPELAACASVMSLDMSLSPTDSAKEVSGRVRLKSAQAGPTGSAWRTSHKID